MYDLVEGKQYFPDDLIKLKPDEIFVDIGAYTGDTLSYFLKISNSHFEKYLVFEPDLKNFEILKRNVDSFENPNIQIFNIGASTLVSTNN